MEAKAQRRDKEMRNENNGKNRGKSIRRLWMGIGILIILSPLGIIIPAYFGAGGAWGEWSLEQIEKIAGFVPEGMKRMAGVWKAPMTNYAVPGQGQGPAHSGIGYFFAAVIGIAVTASLVYLLAKILARKNGTSDRP
jgi:hypothetical protein